MSIKDKIDEELARVREKVEEEKRQAHVRPWDRGKGEGGVGLERERELPYCRHQMPQLLIILSRDFLQPLFEGVVY